MTDHILTKSNVRWDVINLPWQVRRAARKQNLLPFPRGKKRWEGRLKVLAGRVRAFDLMVTLLEREHCPGDPGGEVIGAVSAGPLR
jgi:hypothetical protein